MRFAFTEEQNLLRQTVDRFLLERYDFSQRRAYIARGTGFSRETWSALAGLGVLALPFAERHGGMGGGALGSLLVMEAFGRALVAEPYLPCIILAGGVLRRAADEAQAERLVPPLARGEKRYALAYAEPQSRYNLADVGATARKVGDEYVLSGRKIVVYGAPGCDALLVTARTSGGRRDPAGVSVFLVPADASGVSRRDHRTIDGMSASEIELEEVRVPVEDLIGGEGRALPALQGAMNEAICAACAECVGIMEALNAKTLEHARTREAFGQPLSKFQVLQHRLVDMHVAYEYAAAMTMKLAVTLDGGDEPATSLAASAAKHQVGVDADFVGKNAIQIHGAIGVTEELDVAHYFRRLTALRAMFGTPDHHIRRYIALRAAGATEPEPEIELKADEVRFREEVRAFLAENLTDAMREAARNTAWVLAEFEYGRRWQKALHAKGWGAPDWPVEFGGCDWTPTQKMIWELEMAKAAPPEPMRMGRNLCAPCIMKFGTEQQKAEFLPPMLSGDDWWAQGYSEPGAGSDLASLKLSAVSSGDDYILNGSKIWTTFAQHANRMFCLVRTSAVGKKQEGITFLLIDMNAPGIEIKPIINIAGDHEFNQVFFTDVRVPKSRRLGEENKGWDVARHLLRFEHGAGLVRANAAIKRRLDWVGEIAGQECDGEGGRMADDPDFARRFAEAEIATLALDFGAKQALAGNDASVPPPAIAELLNIRNREVGQALTQLAVDAIGYYAAPFSPEARKVGSNVEPPGPRHTLMPTPLFLSQRAASIAGGTPEVHRNNVARHLLKL